MGKYQPEGLIHGAGSIGRPPLRNSKYKVGGSIGVDAPDEAVFVAAGIVPITSPFWIGRPGTTAIWLMPLSTA